MINPWFKFYGSEFLSDPKISSLTASERSCWITLLCLASTSSNPGEIEFLTTETLLKKSGIEFDPYNSEEWKSSLGVLKVFEKMKMITTNEDGSIQIINWSKRQDSALTNAERQAKYRLNKNSNEKVTKRVTKVTLEENRIEKNRKEEKRDTPHAHMSYLENIPEEDMQYFMKKLGISKSDISSKADDLNNYCKAKGKKYNNYKAFLENALKRDYKKDGLTVKTY